jgi:hypothetical protein
VKHVEQKGNGLNDFDLDDRIALVRIFDLHEIAETIPDADRPMRS